MTHSEIQQLMMVPAALVLLAFMIVAVLVVQGYSMKWAVNVCNAGPIGFFYGLLTTIVMGIVGAITSFGIAMGTGTTNQWVLMLYSVLAGIIVLMLMVRCNPFKAFFAYLCHTVFSLIGCVGVVVVTLLMLFMMSQANVIQLPKNSPATMVPATTGFGSSVPAARNSPAIPSGGNGFQTNPFAE